MLDDDTEVEPPVAFPVEKFVPLQDVAFVDDHVSVDDDVPTANDRFAAIFPRGGVDVTVTVVLVDALPPLPEHVTA